MGFWQNVEKELEYKGISRKELAFRAKIAYQGIGLGIERQSMPRVDTAIKISKVLEVPLEYLIDDADLEIRPSGEKSDINKNKVQKSSQMEDLKPESYYFEFYKNYRKLIDSLEKLPLKIKQPIEDMIIRLADNLENAVVSISREAGSEPEKFPVD